jgi:hypothetical protein
MKCVACGSVVLVEGTLLDSNAVSPTFNPSEVGIWKSMFGVGSRRIRGYACIHCHHLQLAVDFSEKDLQRYQQFEGEQPGVLERINSDPKKLEQ